MMTSDQERKIAILLDLARELGVELRIEKKTKDPSESGFQTAQMRSLCRIADQFDDIKDQISAQRKEEVLDELVNNFWNIGTKRTDKSKNGGSASHFKNIVLCGKRANNICAGLQERRNYWLREQSSGNFFAYRYTEKRDPTRHKGRPAAKFDFFEIEHRPGGGNVLAMVAEVARLYLFHGESVLQNHLFDAIIDNGGARDTLHEKSSRLIGRLVADCEEILKSENLNDTQRVALESAANLLRSV